MVSPGRITRAESLRRAGIEAGRTCLGVAAMLIAAAAIESYLRQSHLSTTGRLALCRGLSAVLARLFRLRRDAPARSKTR